MIHLRETAGGMFDHFVVEARLRVSGGFTGRGSEIHVKALNMSVFRNMALCGDTKRN